AGGIFNPRRRAQPGLVDTVTTLTEVFKDGVMVASGNADAVHSVLRLVQPMIGCPFNNRLLQGGLAGEPQGAQSGKNPDGFPAGENLTQAAIGAHRMFETQSAALQRMPVFIKLFTDAFPEEAATAAARNDPNLLINDETVLRAL